MKQLIKKTFTYGLLLTGFMMTSMLWVYIMMVVIKKLKYAI